MAPVDPASPPEQEGLIRLLIRLSERSMEVDFQANRQMALGLVLQPYLTPEATASLSPLEEEIQLAEWYLFADYLPVDGQLSLVEQIRDDITNHVPDEERRWLDPVRHSYMDLLTIVDTDPSVQPNCIELQSLGDRQRFRVLYPIDPMLQKTRVLLTRLIRGPSTNYLPGPPLVLSAAMGATLLTFTHDLRRQIEFGTGNFALAEWPEFMKSYGYLLIWSLARIRGGAMAAADAKVTYWNEKGGPFLYAIAVYEHHEFRILSGGLNEWDQFTVSQPGASPAQGAAGAPGITVWIQKSEEPETGPYAVARLTLTPTQLFVEADSAERLDSLKHQLAATFGFTLHFKGEILTAPPHSSPQVDLLADQYVAPPVTVPLKEEIKLLSSFLEKVYLEWAEQPCPALKNETPRHYCRDSQKKKEVAALIDEMERHDLGFQRTGQRAYNYTILRDHLGL